MAQYWMKYDDEKLAQLMAQQKEIADAKRAEAAEIDREIAEYQQEFHRRALETFWENNPNLLQLNIGDKLLVTAEFQQYKRDTIFVSSAAFDSYWKIGKVFIIKSVDPIEDDGYIEDADKGGTACPYSVMVGMRRAYLEREGQEQK